MSTRAHPLRPENPAAVKVSVVAATATSVQRETLELPSGSTVRDALERVEFAKAFAIHHPAQTHHSDSNVGIWGRRVLLDTALADGDRIELYRPITADAKSARLARAAEQGYRWQGKTRRRVK